MNYDIVDIWKIRNPIGRNLLGDKKAQLSRDALIIGSLVIRQRST